MGRIIVGLIEYTLVTILQGYGNVPTPSPLTSFFCILAAHNIFSVPLHCPQSRVENEKRFQPKPS